MLVGLSVVALSLVPADGALLFAKGRPPAPVAVAADAGPWERRAADDLARCVGLMTGTPPPLLDRVPEGGPAVVVGKLALALDPALGAALSGVAKKNPVVRADAIARRSRGPQVLLAGTNDESHAFAAYHLLGQWGCRWYVPGPLGECVPERDALHAPEGDFAYAPPFEVRHYWLSWNAASEGADAFRRRNFMTETSPVGMGHALVAYTKKLVPPGKTMFNVPLSEEATAKSVAEQIAPEYAKGVPGISLAIEDGNYVSDSPRDRELQAGVRDKYTLEPSNTDAMLTLYNAVGKALRGKYPSSPTKIGGLAYANVTLPPQRVLRLEPNVLMWLAPIDIDPNHHMDDPRSPPRQEYKAMLYRWAEATGGKLAIYDYDQSQLVWRDLPAPTHRVFARDVKHYRKAGVLGIGTESRGATATTFLNLFFRGQLMWNPDADAEALLREFYPAFYGPAAGPMGRYWDAVFAAWDATLCTEHEYFIAPFIYTPELVSALRAHLDEAKRVAVPPGRNGALLARRLEFAEMGQQLLERYLEMVRLGGSECDYAAAAAAGATGLEVRERLTAMDPTFTTYKNIGESGAAWWPGEVQQMRDLAALCDGKKGTLVAKLPVEWAFRRDPRDTGLPRGWGYTPPDLSFWNGRGKAMSAAERKDYPDAWEVIRADRYPQGQGVLHPDGQSYTGHYWYAAELTLTPEQASGKLRLMFPGLFNECWLYVNGVLVAHRAYNEPWWRNDYKFEWDADVAGALKPGANAVTLRGVCPHHFGGMFRRPFLYRAP